MTKRVERDPCFAKAMPDEPAFVLLARDPMAPILVRLWAQARRVAISEGSRPQSDLPQVQMAELEAEDMVAWRRDADASWRN